MILAIENNNVFGYYYYEKYKTKIFLEGTINGKEISIKEAWYDETNFITGFIGQLTDSAFVGAWVNKAKGISWKSALKINTNKTETLSEDITGIVGHYDRLANSDKYFGFVEFKYIYEDLFSFEISNATESGCVGYMNGIVKLEDLKSGI